MQQKGCTLRLLIIIKAVIQSLRFSLLIMDVANSQMFFEAPEKLIFIDISCMYVLGILGIDHLQTFFLNSRYFRFSD